MFHIQNYLAHILLLVAVVIQMLRWFASREKSGSVPLRIHSKSKPGAPGFDLAFYKKDIKQRKPEPPE